jgi:hypothetical protein
MTLRPLRVVAALRIRFLFGPCLRVTTRFKSLPEKERLRERSLASAVELNGGLSLDSYEFDLIQRLYPASRMMRYHVNAALCEFTFDVTGQKPLRFLMPLQDSIHVANGEAAHKNVGLFT